MVAYFFDTSALVRRYDAAEPGSDRVRALCRRSSGHALLVSRIAVIEVAAALNRKLREGRFDVAQRDQRWRLFRRHLRHQYRVNALEAPTFEAAERLVFAHPMRAYDALQLASALHSARLLAGLVADFWFCTADRAQAGAATAEGLQVELIS